MFYLSTRSEKLAVDKLDPEVPWWLGLISIGVLFFLFKLMQRVSEPLQAKIAAREQLLEAKADPFHSFASNENV